MRTDNRSVIPTGPGMSRKQRLTTATVSESLAGTLVLCSSAVLINLVKYTDMKTPSGRRLYQKHGTAPDTLFV